jgi:hypothetical protein
MRAESNIRHLQPGLLSLNQKVAHDNHEQWGWTGEATG